MKFIAIILTTFLLIPGGNWETDFSKAKLTAAGAHKVILLNFSGSDWCGPCIKLHKDIFESSDFTSFADQNLVLVNADFPRQKKNQLTKTLQQQNDSLADKYNAEGIFPLTVLLDAEGKKIRSWEGYPKQGAAAFISELKLAVHEVN